MKIITLTQGKEALVDDADYEKAKGMRWHAVYVSGNWYANHGTRIGERKNNRIHSLRLHRFLLDVPPEYVVDHIDGNGLNCQRYNMRVCTKAENSRNRKREIRNKSGYKGVSWDKAANKWQARVKINGKPIYLGWFSDPKEAAVAYDKGAVIYHGVYARLNFPV